MTNARSISGNNAEPSKSRQPTQHSRYYNHDTVAVKRFCYRELDISKSEEEDQKIHSRADNVTHHGVNMIGKVRGEAGGPERKCGPAARCQMIRTMTMSINKGNRKKGSCR
jgi:hypothetical protein